MKLPRPFALLGFALAPLALVSAPETDREIAAALKSTYNFHALLADAISVEVLDGTVTLAGAVRDEDLKSIAENTAATLPGVARVENRITIEDAPAARSDAAIASKIRTALFVSPGIAVDAVRIEVKRGEVTLSGVATSYLQKAHLTRTVSEIEGVYRLQNALVVSDHAPGFVATREHIDDASVAALVKFVLANNVSTNRFKAVVTVRNGVVTIGGNASSVGERYEAVRLVAELRGVQSVVNNVVLL